MRLGPLCILVLSGIVWAQIEKPSPVPSRNKKQSVEAPPPATTKKQVARRARSEGEAQRSAPAGNNVGTACFFKPKAGTEGPKLRAAHPTYATGTKLKVTNLGNSKSVVVTVTDHGDLSGRIISVSYDAASELGFTRAGTAQVRLEVLKD